jgi:RNA polymerase sigma-70 factor, ECF subfamily
MQPEQSHDFTTLLADYGSSNDPELLQRLMPVVYEELHRLASAYLRRERSDHTLQPTALVHESYLKLVDQRMSWRNRAHFFGIAAEAMRRILTSHARTRAADKRGGGARKVELLDEIVAGPAPEREEVEILALDSALERLAAFDPRQAEIVKLRYFAGLSIEQTAEVLNVSPTTVKREWSMARSWLRRELRQDDE